MADYSWVAPLIQLGTAAVGEGFANASKEDQKRILERAMAEYGNIDLPTLEKVAAEEVGPSAYEGIKTDPRLKDAQYAALAKLGEIDESGGMTLEDQVALRRVQNQLARQEMGQRASILENMRARGVGGSGAELAMQLQAQQGGAQRANEAGMDTAARAAQRRFDAILARGRMGGDIRNQEYSEQARAAEARDQIARYNAGARTRAAEWNNRLPQQQFENSMNLARGRTGVAGGMADYYGQQGQQQRQMWNTVGTYGANEVDRYYNRQDQLATQARADALRERERQDRLAREEEDRRLQREIWGIR